MTAPNFLLGLVSLPLKLMSQSTSISNTSIKNVCVCVRDIYIYTLLISSSNVWQLETSMDPKGSLTRQFPGLSQDPYLQVKLIIQGWWSNPVWSRQSHEKRWMSRCRIQLNRLNKTLFRTHTGPFRPPSNNLQGGCVGQISWRPGRS